MITRIVKMSFHPTKVDDFLQNFETHKAAIRAFDGCSYLELLQETNGSVFFTYSKWENEAKLEAYRNSTLFKGVWTFTKSLFNDKPQAWTVESLKILS